MILACRQRRVRWLAFAVAVGMLCATAGCGLLNGPSQPDSTDNSHNLEKPNIAVGLNPLIDGAPFYIAQAKGYFAAEGLHVKVVPATSGADCIPLLAGGHVDACMSNWSTVLSAEEKQVGDYRILADAGQGKSGVMIVAARPDSGIKGPKDLVGKTVSTSTVDDIPELALKAILQANGVDYNQLRFVVIHHPQTPAALANKLVDAAIQVEPYITKAREESGTEPVVDLLGPGVMHDLPIAGWFSLKKFTTEDPKTAAAFQRALDKGSADAANDQAVRQVLPSYLGIDASTAALVTIPVFPTSLSATRLRRVADLMTTYGQLKGHLDVAPLLFVPQH
jgi:NitT/TauT family transport system substrate-binding protein